MDKSQVPFGPDWTREVTLADGTLVTLRAVRPGDKAELRDGILHLSPKARAQRFFTSVFEPTESTLRYLTEVDQENHVAIGAVVASPDLKEEHGVGVARFVRLDGHPKTAEAAITVLDAYQGRGIGKVLLEELARIAYAKGIRRFRAEVLASNTPMHALLADVGVQMNAEETSDGTRVVDVELRSKRTDLFALLRIAARAVRLPSFLVPNDPIEAVAMSASAGPATTHEERDAQAEQHSEGAGRGRRPT